MFPSPIISSFVSVQLFESVLIFNIRDSKKLV